MKRLLMGVIPIVWIFLIVGLSVMITRELQEEGLKNIIEDVWYGNEKED